MTSLSTASDASMHNPLDSLEEFFIAQEWPFHRASEDELAVEVAGRWCSYNLFFLWQDHFSALQFTCQMDIKAPDRRLNAVMELMGRINPKLWLGHFDLSQEEERPQFRQTCLLRGARATAGEPLQDLIDIALAECERFYPAFQFVIWGGKTPQEAIEAAILETAGEA
jgi:hypothetical protein